MGGGRDAWHRIVISPRRTINYFRRGGVSAGRKHVDKLDGEEREGEEGTENRVGSSSRVVPELSTRRKLQAIDIS